MMAENPDNGRIKARASHRSSDDLSMSQCVNLASCQISHDFRFPFVVFFVFFLFFFFFAGGFASFHTLSMSDEIE